MHELLLLRDIGYWSHFVADGSQPLHVTTHFNGWGSFPNPDGFTSSKSTHAHFEGEFVSAHVSRAEVAKALPPAKDLGCEIETLATAYLRDTNQQVRPFYLLEKQHAFRNATLEGRAFAIGRLATGAAELRDLVVAAWRCSEQVGVGYPPVPVKDVESGKTNPIRELSGRD